MYDRLGNKRCVLSLNMCCMVVAQALGDMAPKYILEHYLEAELMVNITEHQVGECL